MRSMPRRVRLLAAVGVLVGVAPSAHADPLPGDPERAVVRYVLPDASASNAAGDTIHGGCFLAAVKEVLLTGNFSTGVLGDASVTTDRKGVPTGATVTCVVAVNGVEIPSTRVSANGLGVQADAGNIWFFAADDDTVGICQDVTFADFTVLNRCATASVEFVPPRASIPLVHNVFVQDVDPSACPELIALGQIVGGNILGVIEIGLDGDVYISGFGPAYDCPPY
jgi:hypothetical protein